MKHDEEMIKRIRSRVVITGCLIILLVFSVALTLSVMTRSAETTITRPMTYSNVDRVTYAASVPPASIYGRNTITTGEVIFTGETQSVLFQLSYYLETPYSASVSGSVQLVGAIKADGILRTVFASPAMRFVGNQGVVTVPLSMATYRQIVQLFDQATGLGSYELQIEPIVHATGTIEQQPFSTSFSQNFVFGATDSEIVPPGLANPGGANPSTASSTSSLSKSQTQLVNRTTVLPSKITAGPVEVPLADARAIASLGTLLLLALVIVMSRSVSRMLRSNEQLRIALRYRPSLVWVTSVVNDGDQVVEVEAIGDLGAMARKFETFIQVVKESDCISYFVRDGRTCYRYQIPCSALSGATDSEAQGETELVVADAGDRREGVSASEKTSGDRLFQQA
ncbi:MAG: hypothetical protein HKL81_04180 [Acidimicrobiaceae bacterium]|nr:hypothetical protein [Acidimicrobiaceae bacterium]